MGGTTSTPHRKKSHSGNNEPPERPERPRCTTHLQLKNPNGYDSRNPYRIPKQKYWFATHTGKMLRKNPWTRHPNNLHKIG